MLACICHSHESCGRNATDLPRPKRWKARTGRSRREPSVALSSVVAPGFTASTALMVVSSGNSGQRADEAASVAAICDTAWPLPARVGRTARRVRGGSAEGACAGQHHRQRLAERGAGVAAFAERPRSAEHQQAAAALVHELGQHRQLVAGEGRRLDAAEDETAVLEELVAGLGEAAHEFLGVVDLEAQVLVVGGALQHDELQLLVVGEGAAQELHLEARLAFEVEDLLAPVAHVDEHVAGVVLGQQLARLRRHAEGEDARARLRRGEAHAHRGGLAVGAERDRLAADDLAAVEHVEGQRLSGVAVRRDDGVEQQRGAGQHRARRGDPADLDVLLGGVAADADGEDRHARGLEREQRRLQRRAARVGAVAHDHEPGQRHAGQLPPGFVERGGQTRVGAGEGQVLAGRGRAERAGKAQRPHRELLAEGLAQSAVGGAELLLDVGAARLAVDVGDAHAARVVEQHADDVLVRHGGAQHEHRPEQAQEQHADEGRPQRGQHPAVSRGQAARRALVGQDRDGDGHHRQPGRDQGA